MAAVGLGPNKGTWGDALGRLVALWEPLPGPHAVLRAAFFRCFHGCDCLPGPFAQCRDHLHRFRRRGDLFIYLTGSHH